MQWREYIARATIKMLYYWLTDAILLRYAISDFGIGGFEMIDQFDKAILLILQKDNSTPLREISAKDHSRQHRRFGPGPYWQADHNHH